MTEDKAKGKSCPLTMNALAVALAVAPSAHDQGVLFDVQPRKCIGSACMAWRWLEREPLTPHGYCGLAIKPE
jgi:hypothetical protein